MQPPSTYMGLVNKPETFLQLLLSPPHTLHLSNFFLEPSFPSQPALMHLPWTQTEVESGEQGVPSTTCGGETSCCGPASPHTTPLHPAPVQPDLRRCWQVLYHSLFVLCFVTGLCWV